MKSLEEHGGRDRRDENAVGGEKRSREEFRGSAEDVTSVGRDC